MKKGSIIFISITAIIVMALGGWYMLEKKKRQKFLDQRTKARELHHKGDVGRSIPLLESLMSEVANKIEETNLKFILVSDYLRVNEQTSMRLLKEIAADEVNIAYFRGLAIQQLADLYMLGSRRATAADAIFFGDPYISFLDFKRSSPILFGIKELYEYGLSFIDEPLLPINHYRIAEWYADQLINEPDNYTKKEKSEFFEKLNEHISEGEKAFPHFIARPHEVSLVVYVHWLRGHVLGNFALLEDNEEKRSLADAAFKDSILFASNEPGIHTKKQLLWASLYYAIFLDTHYGQSRADDIKERLHFLLKIKDEFSDTPFNRFFATLLARTETEYKALREKIISLSLYDKDFAEMLKERGWKI